MQTDTLPRTPAGSANAANQNLTWGQLSVINAQRVMDLAGPFVDDQTDDNLIHLKDGEDVGQWRDSGNGLPSRPTRPPLHQPELTKLRHWRRSHPV